MQATSSENLDLFLQKLKEYGCYFFVPAVLKNGEPQPLNNLSILKNKIIVKPAWKIGPNDREYDALMRIENPVIPNEEKEPPILKAIEKFRTN